MEELVVLKGIAERLLFEASDSDYRVFRLHEEKENQTYTVTGHGVRPLVGDRLEVTGRWVEHKRYGRQFAAEHWQRVLPESTDGIIRFLGSGAVRGVGPALAKRIVDVFGEDTMQILEKEPQRLLEVEGIGKKKLADIIESFGEEKQVNDVAYDLEQHGIAGRYASRLVQKYGDDVAYVLQEEPYRLIAEIEGIGFKTADQIALAYGMQREDHQRLAAGLTYVLRTMTQNGHVCIPDTELVRRAAFMLQSETLPLAETLTEAIRIGQLLTDDYNGVRYVYTPEANSEECYLALRILEMAAMPPLPMHTHVELFLDRWQDSCHFELAEKQREAVERSLQSGMTVITGGPGTGKTTVVQTIIRLAEQEGLRIMLCAPTGRAAKRLAETTQRTAKTIHRLLGPNGYVGGHPVFEHDETNPLPANLVIVDEVSMLDMEMMYHLLLALKPECRCILVGDADQLPSVGAGAILHDIIASKQVPVVRLDTIFRQEQGGRIVTNAHLINSGRLPVLNKDNEFRFVDIEDETDGAEKVASLYKKEMVYANNDKFAVQVLSPMYKNPCGVDNLNHLIQLRLNRGSSEKSEIKVKNMTLRVGDKVMQKHNDYDKGVFNGDIGEIFAIEDGVVYVRYPEQDVRYDGQEIDEITLAYAITVHKSQGSEYHTVIIVLVDSHAILLQRNLLYTAVTRAKRKVILVGTKRALNTAIQNQRTNRRFTLLIQRLQGRV